MWCAVSCPNLPLSSVSRSISGRCGGWIWQGARFVASGQPIGDGNMWRRFHCLRRGRRQNLLLVRPGLYVRAIAGVGKTASRAMRVQKLLGRSRSGCSVFQQPLPHRSDWRQRNRALIAIAFPLLGQAGFSEWRCVCLFFWPFLLFSHLLPLSFPQVGHQGSIVSGM